MRIRASLLEPGMPDADTVFSIRSYCGATVVISEDCAAPPVLRFYSLVRTCVRGCFSLPLGSSLASWLCVRCFSPVHSSSVSTERGSEPSLFLVFPRPPPPARPTLQYPSGGSPRPIPDLFCCAHKQSRSVQADVPLGRCPGSRSPMCFVDAPRRPESYCPFVSVVLPRSIL